MSEKQLQRVVQRMTDATKAVAAQLNLPFKAIRFSPADKEVYGRICEGNDLRVDLKEGVIQYKMIPEYLDKMSPDYLKATVEHELCHCVDYLEEIYGSEIFVQGASPETNPFMVMILEIYASFTDYFATMRQSREFGVERAKEWHAKGMGNFLTNCHESILLAERLLASDYLPNGEPCTPDIKDAVAMDREGIVFALFKEYIKSEIVGYTNPNFAPGVMEVSRNLPECFEAIRQTDTCWIDKSKMNYFTGVTIKLMYDLGFVYFSGNAMKSDENMDIIEKCLDDIPFESPACRDTCGRIVELL